MVRFIYSLRYIFRPGIFHTPRLLRFRSRLADIYCKWRWGISWESSYIWCPSQLTGTHPKMPAVEVYCRWRWSDPWTIKIMQSESFDILNRIDSKYKDTQVFRLKLKASRCLYDYVKKHWRPDLQKYFDDL